MKKIFRVYTLHVFIFFFLLIVFILTSFNNIFKNKVDIIDIENVECLEHLKDQVMNQLNQEGNKGNKSLHIWYKDLNQESKGCIFYLVKEIKDKLVKMYNVDNIIPVLELTEINVTGKTTKNSEKIYFTRHFDSPYSLTPCTMIRAIFAINGTPDTNTIFSNKVVNLSTGKVALFDYSRGAHSIQISNKKENNKENSHIPRIIGKFHFIIPSKIMGQIGDNWCISLFNKWGTYSRNILSNNQDKASFTTILGIYATYLSTYMHFIALGCLILLLGYVFTNSIFLLSLYVIFFLFIFSYYLYVLAMVIRHSF